MIALLATRFWNNHRRQFSSIRQTDPSSATPRPKGTLALGEFGSSGKLDPYLFSRNYEPGELRHVLSSATLARLKEAAEVVQAREPGTAPRGRTKKADMIDYIVEHVVGPGY